jgi:hypothetical protein
MIFIHDYWSKEKGKGRFDETSLLPSGASFIKSWLYNPNIFSQIRLRHEILELRYRNDTRMP